MGVGQLAVVRNVPSPQFEVWNGNNNHRLTTERFDSEESALEWIKAHGFTTKPKFTKVIGGWLFETEGVQWIAHHNEAGFSGRAWELWSVNVKSGAQERVVADMLPSRAACVEQAEDYMRD